MQVQLTLYPMQHDFVLCDAPFSAFIGGIGSGKSFAGALKTLLAANRTKGLGLVIAPTYPMLRDASLRTFLSIAGDACSAFNKAEMHAFIRGGGEVLFRSADQPDRLRGPNASFAWIDEAALCPPDTWEVVIGRLRERGRMGQAWITTTPKGRQHWTYSVFGQGKPDTQLFHARTQDNPFLPAQFYQMLREQYTSTLAAQELEGQFVDFSGGMFQSHWFEIVDTTPAAARRVRYWDKAGTQGGGAYTAGVLMSTVGGVFYVEDVVRGQWSAGQREQVIQMTARKDKELYGNVAIWLEQEPGSGGKESAEATVRSLAGYNVHAERATGSKVVRAEPFAAQAEAGNVKLKRAAWNANYLDEFSVFPEGPFKDQVDASSGAFNTLAGSHPAPPPRGGGERPILAGYRTR